MILDMALFTAINIFAIAKLQSAGLGLFAYLKPLHLLILGLAVYRGANIISNEFITVPLRAHFVRRFEQDGKEIEEPYDQGFRGFLGSLLYCPSCTGVWVAMILVYSFLFWPAAATPVIIVLALSGLERFFAYTFGRIKKG